MDNWQAWAIGAAVVVAVGAFARVARKQKWADKLNAFGVKCGKALSILLLRWLPPTAAEKAEEGIIVTLLALVAEYLKGVEIGLLSDNIHRLKRRGEK